ncbi:MAG: TatD family hydrolase [Candidatus Kapaibacterium sp.]
MIHTHALIDTEAFAEDIDQVIARAKAAGVEHIVIPAIQPDGFDNLVALVDKYDMLYFGIGVHPHSADKFDDEVERRIREIAKHPKCVAIGEIGLDYYYHELSAADVQKKAFRRQIEIAKELEKPIIVHNRDSDDDLIEILKEYQDGNLKAVLHCFPESKELLGKAIDLGFNVSFTGNITFKKSEHKEVLELVPLDRFMIETDSPYMAPVPNRGKRNEPSFVQEIAKKISEVKNMNYENILEQSTKNAKSFFKIMMLVLSIALFTQTTYAQDDYRYNDEYIDEEADYEKAPYPKFIGIGGFAGTNTIVESKVSINDPSQPDRNISYEGITSLGGTVTYGGLADYLVLQLGYVYSKNIKVQETSPGALPNIHQIIELSSLWIPNPHNKINVFGAIGPSLIMNSINGVDNSQIGLNTGVGFIFNIPIKGLGLLNLAAEWRLNFELSSVEKEDIKQNEPNVTETIESKSFHSIPRLNLIFYPEF